MNSLDLQTKLMAAATLTSTGGVIMTDAVNQSTVYGHIENQLDMVGLFVPFSAVTISGSQTYQFQILTDSASALTTTPIVVADTGAMSVTDARLTGTNGFTYIFLPIQWGTVLQAYVGAKYTFANSPSMTIGGAWITSLSAIQNFWPFPLNYTP